MKIIGLTGGIGTGKSTVSAYLSGKNIKICDADKIAHDITAPGSPVLADIRKYFGDEVFAADGSMDRKKMAELVFADPKQKMKLETLTMPKIIAAIRDEAENARNSGEKGIFIIDAPLLFEVGLDTLCDATWLVDAEDDIRIRRVMQRDGCSAEHVKMRMKNQIPRQKAQKLANEIIDNSGNEESLYRQVDELIKKYED